MLINRFLFSGRSPHFSFSHNSTQRAKLVSACVLFQAAAKVTGGFLAASASRPAPARTFSKYRPAMARLALSKLSKFARISASEAPGTDRERATLIRPSSSSGNA